MARAVERGRKNKDPFVQSISPEKMDSDQQGPWISKSAMAPVEEIAEPGSRPPAGEEEHAGPASRLPAGEEENAEPVSRLPAGEGGLEPASRLPAGKG